MTSHKFSRPEPPETDDPDAAWKELLAPFGELEWQMERMLDDCSDAKLEEIRDACEKPTNSNCWFATFRAAKWILTEVNREIASRKYKREVERRAHPTSPPRGESNG